MRTLYESILDGEDKLMDKADNAAAEVARINKMKAERGQAFRDYIEKKFGVKFETHSRTNWKGQKIESIEAVKHDIDEKWYKNNRPKLAKLLTDLGSKDDPLTYGYLDRGPNSSIRYIFYVNNIGYTVGTIEHDAVSSRLLFHCASL